MIANEEKHVLALIHPMERSTVTIHNCQRAANNHAIPLRPPSGRYIVAVPVNDICDVCVCVLLSNELCFGSPSSLFAALDNLDFFSKFSGLKVNCSKTKIVWIGSKKFSKQVFHHTRWKLDWGSTTFVLLGIHFQYN